MLGRRILRDAMLRIAPQDEAEGETRFSLHVMAGLDPRIPLRQALCSPHRDGRDIGVRKDAVLRTAMPGHDVVRFVRSLFPM